MCRLLILSPTCLSRMPKTSKISIAHLFSEVYIFSSIDYNLLRQIFFWKKCKMYLINGMGCAIISFVGSDCCWISGNWIHSPQQASPFHYPKKRHVLCWTCLSFCLWVLKVKGNSTMVVRRSPKPLMGVRSSLPLLGKILRILHLSNFRRRHWVLITMCLYHQRVPLKGGFMSYFDADNARKCILIWG